MTDASPLVRQLREDLATAVDLLRSFVDDEPCDFDHHGYCQAHNSFDEPNNCHVAEARTWLAARAARHHVFFGEDDSFAVQHPADCDDPTTCRYYLKVKEWTGDFFAKAGGGIEIRGTYELSLVEDTLYIGPGGV